MALTTENTAYEKKLKNIELYSDGIEDLCKLLFVTLGEEEISISASEKTNRKLVLNPQDDISKEINALEKYSRGPDIMKLRAKSLKLSVTIRQSFAEISTQESDYKYRPAVDAVYDLLKQYEAHGLHKYWREYMTPILLATLMLECYFSWLLAVKYESVFYTALTFFCFFTAMGSPSIKVILSQNLVYYTRKEKINIFYANRNELFVNLISALVGFVFGYWLAVVTSVTIPK